MIYLGFVFFVALIISAVIALMWSLQAYPDAAFIKLFTANKEIAGTVIGTAMALIAAGAAFMSVQLQIGFQRRATQISENTFWQQQSNEADVVASGLRITAEAIDAVQKAYDARAGQHPHITATLRLQETGALDMSNWPPTGSDLISWDLNLKMASLRIWHNRTFNNMDDVLRTQADAEMKSAYDAILALRPRVAAARAKYASSKTNADKMLRAIELTQ